MEKPIGKKKKRNISEILSGIILIGIIIFLVNLCTAPSKSSEPSVSSGPDKIEALVMSETFVKKFLKAPSTAQFPLVNDSEVSINQEGNIWTVNAYVDAQNSFGAMIRSKYRCVLEYVGDDEWRLKELILDGEKLF